jgi:hypothetical protein
MLSNFQYLKPWFVKKLHEWNIWCCRYHIEINELKENFNGIKSQAKGVYGQCKRSCIEICCPIGKETFVVSSPS